jgi:hypothetical protein
MAQRYLLSCECGRSHTITTARAGERLVCECGKTLVVPTLAGIRQLQPVVEKQEVQATWNPVRGLLFVVGTIAAIIGLGIGGYYGWHWQQIDVNAYADYESRWQESNLEEIDKMSPDDLYDTWKAVESRGHGEAGTALTVQAKAAKGSLQTFTIAGFSVAAVGIALAGLSLLGNRTRPV